jgi:hypothetical protein
MSILKKGGLAKIISDNDDQNIGKIVSLYAYHDEYMGYKDVWLFDCNEGVYVNGSKKFTSIGIEAKDLEFYK